MCTEALCFGVISSNLVQMFTWTCEGNFKYGTSDLVAKGQRSRLL